MISVEHFLRLCDILLQPRLLAPWQAQKHIEVIADDGCLCTHRLHAFKLLQFAFSLGLGLFRKLGLLDLLRKLGNLITVFAIAAAKLRLDRFQLLIEIIFALGFLHLAFHAPTNFALDLKDGQLALHKGHHHFQPLQGVRFDQHGLFVGNLCRDRSGNGIG